MKLSTSGSARLVEKRSDERDNTKLTNAIRDIVNGQGQYFADAVTTGATSATVWTDNMAPNSVLMLWCDFVAFHSDADIVAMTRRYHFQCNSLGSAALIGTSTIGTDDNGPAATATATGGANGLVSVAVAGLFPAHVLYWRVSLRGVWTPFE